MATRSVIAHPTDAGYAGRYCHWDGYPSHQLPLLLAAYQHRFANDLDALAHHLIDEAPGGWSVLGTDLLDGAPPTLRTELFDETHPPSEQRDNMATPDGSPPKPFTVTHEDRLGLEWAYVLHAHGIEVIGLRDHDCGPLVPWDTDPHSRFSNHSVLWQIGHPIPVKGPTPAVSAAARITSGRARSPQPTKTASTSPAPPTHGSPAPARPGVRAR
jgi:hypothetical protein